jgi:hypothetical protein
VKIRNEFRDSDARLHPQQQIKYYAIQSIGTDVCNDVAESRRAHEEQNDRITKFKKSIKRSRMENGE